MSDPTFADGTPQFSTAEYPGTPGTGRCKSCNQAITGSYYRVNGAMACPACGERVKRQLPQDSPAAFTRGLLFGVGGAILGLILYAAFGIITGLMIGYVSLAVDYIVGKAIKMGSGGVGGRRYQIAAVVLTYAAVSITAIPIYIAQAAKEHKVERVQQSQTVPGPAEKGAMNVSPAPQQVAPSAEHPPNLLAALISLVLIGLASPFLELQDPFHGIIGLIILLVGLRIAWKIAAGISIQILGPFKLSAPTAGPAAG